MITKHAKSLNNIIGLPSDITPQDRRNAVAALRNGKRTLTPKQLYQIADHAVRKSIRNGETHHLIGTVNGSDRSITSKALYDRGVRDTVQAALNVDATPVNKSKLQAVDAALAQATPAVSTAVSTTATPAGKTSLTKKLLSKAIGAMVAHPTALRVATFAPAALSWSYILAKQLSKRLGKQAPAAAASGLSNAAKAGIGVGALGVAAPAAYGAAQYYNEDNTK